MALASPSVSFSVLHNGKVDREFPEGNSIDRIGVVIGNNFYCNYIEIEEMGAYSLPMKNNFNGFFSKPKIFIEIVVLKTPTFDGLMKLFLSLVVDV